MLDQVAPSVPSLPPVPAKAPAPTQTQILKLAAHAGSDPRSARKAIMYGPDAVRGLAGERLAASMLALGIEPLSGAAR